MKTALIQSKSDFILELILFCESELRKPKFCEFECEDESFCNKLQFQSLYPWKKFTLI